MRNVVVVPAGDAALPGTSPRCARRDRPHALISGNGQPAALLTSPADPRQHPGVADGAWTALKEYRPSLPPSVKLQVVYDLAEFVRGAVAACATRSDRQPARGAGAGRLPARLARDRDRRGPLPLTLVGTFFVLQLVGGTINLMSLGGLAIAIGLVIDDAIVVVENIYRHRRWARPVAVAAGRAHRSAGGGRWLGAHDRGGVRAAGPLQGVVVQFFAALSLTLSAAVLLSLGYALFFIPNAAARFLEGQSAPAVRPGRLAERYRALLRASLERPRRVAIVTLCLAALGGIFYLRLETGFLTEMDEGGYVIDYWTPEGTSLAETDRMVHRIEEVVAATPEVAGFARRTGAELGLFATEQNRGDIVVKLKPPGARPDERSSRSSAPPSRRKCPG